MSYKSRKTYKGPRRRKGFKGKAAWSALQRLKKRGRI